MQLQVCECQKNKTIGRTNIFYVQLFVGELLVGWAHIVKLIVMFINIQANW